MTDSSITQLPDYTITQLFRAVPMGDFDFISRSCQLFLDLFGDHHRAVLPAGAAEADGQVALSFADVVRQQIDQQLADAGNKFPSLGKRADVLGDLGVASGEGPQLRDKMRIG